MSPFNTRATRIRIRIALIAIVTFLGLIAGACGSGAGDSAVATASDGTDSANSSSASVEDGEDNADGEAETAAVNSDDEPTIGETRENYYSPISEALGQDPSVGFDDENFAEHERDAQVQIRECMLAQGFEYDIVEFNDGNMMDGMVPGEDDMTEGEYIEKYGFGVSTMFAEELERENNPQTSENPNDARVNAMTAGEREAYYNALHGSDPFEGFEFDEATGEPIDPETGKIVNFDEFFRDHEPDGCEESAYRAMETDLEFGAGAGELDEEIQNAMMDLYDSIEADPRVVAANDGWSGCMSEGGYSYRTIDDLFLDIEEKMEPFWSSFDGGPFGGVDVDIREEDFESMTDEEQNEFTEEMSAAPVLTDEQKVELAEINEYELEVSGAAWACRGSIIETYDEVRIDLEEQFVRDNQAAFDAAKIAAGS